MIKAIETKYQGYRFRSRLEARWAVFFDALEISWEYEKEGFVLGEVGYYLPDFWLPDINAWIEIKGQKASEQEIAKCRALKRHLGGWGSIHAMLLGGEVARDVVKKVCAVGRDKFGRSYEKTMSEVKAYLLDAPKVFLFDRGLSGMEHDGRSCWIFLGDDADHILHAEISSFDVLLNFLYVKSPEQFLRAITAAKSARFEHGETPNV